MSLRVSTLSLIGQRYLDTQFDPASLEQLEQTLRARGVTGLRRWLLEGVAAGGLCWNLVWWEWCELDTDDVLTGWLLTSLLMICAGGMAAYLLGWRAGLAAALLVMAGAMLTGLWLRSGSQIRPPADHTSRG